MEIGKLSEKEFRIMIVKMIQDLRKRMETKTEKMQKQFTEDLEELKNKQTEMNTLEGINIRITEAEEWINDLEDRTVEITATEQNMEKKNEKKNEDSLRDLWDNIKGTNICIIGFQKEKRERKDLRKYLKR